jgi:DNA-binding MarR family transcriptional regulator
MAQENNMMTNEANKKSEKYLHMVFSLLKKRENIALSERETHFSNTEIRMIFEILMAKYEGKRLISTQLSKRLGVTRSAISQMVNRLEEGGVVKRVADDVDRKIAYIEVTDETLGLYDEDINNCISFIGRVVKKFGEEKFNTMYDLVEEFMQKIEDEKEEVETKKERKTKKK